jgi:DNA-directed RNA polymerase specialized sigma24 family protein
MDSPTTQPEKWTLTQEGLEVFLAHLDPDRDVAGEKYEEIRRKLMTFFRCNGFSNEQDPVDETIDRVIRRLGEIEVRDLMPFLRGVARHVASETRKRSKEVPLAEVPEPAFLSISTENTELETDHRLRCLDQTVRCLTPDDRELVVEWYLYEKGQKIENKKKLAAARGVSLSTLRVQAFRARERLQKLVQDCLKGSSRAM